MIFCTDEVVPSLYVTCTLANWVSFGHGEIKHFVSDLIHLVARLELEGLVERVAVQRLADFFDDRAVGHQTGEIEQHFPVVIAKHQP